MSVVVMAVADASAIVALLDPTSTAGDWATTALHGPQIVAPRVMPFEAAGALRPGEHEPGRVRGVGRAGVGAVELVERGGRQQALDRRPFGPQLIIVEPLGLQRLGVEREPAELVARLRQEAARIAGVERQISGRLEDRAEPRREQSVGPLEARAGMPQVVNATQVSSVPKGGVDTGDGSFQ